MTTKQRQLKGLARTPVKKRSGGRQSVLLTNELFALIPNDPAMKKNKKADH